MYIGLKLYDMALNQIDFSELSEDNFKFGDEVSRIVYEAALCVRMQEGITFDKVKIGEQLLGKSRLYKVAYIVHGVRVEFIFSVSCFVLSDQYQWMINDAVSRHEKVAFFKNFMLSTIVNFNKGIKEDLFNL